MFEAQVKFTLVWIFKGFESEVGRIGFIFIFYYNGNVHFRTLKKKRIEII